MKTIIVKPPDKIIRRIVGSKRYKAMKAESLLQRMLKRAHLKKRRS
jgi:hypothetical protein